MCATISAQGRTRTSEDRWASGFTARRICRSATCATFSTSQRGRIRTFDLVRPRHTRCQAALHADSFNAPGGNRTLVGRSKGGCPEPLDDRSESQSQHLRQDSNLQSRRLTAGRDTVTPRRYCQPSRAGSNREPPESKPGALPLSYDSTAGHQPPELVAGVIIQPASGRQLREKDSNLHCPGQSRMSCRWTIPEWVTAGFEPTT